MSDRPTIDGYEVIVPSELDTDAYKYNGEYVPVELARQLKRENAELRKQLDQAEARVDALMLEYCPGDMTTAQIERWAKHQAVDATPPASTATTPTTEKPA